MSARHISVTVLTRPWAWSDSPNILAPRCALSRHELLGVAVGMVWPAEQFRSAMYLVAWVHISVTAVGTT